MAGLLWNAKASARLRELIAFYRNFVYGIDNIFGFHSNEKEGCNFVEVDSEL
jgi:hypothetical protein